MLLISTKNIIYFHGEIRKSNVCIKSTLSSTLQIFENQFFIRCPPIYVQFSSHDPKAYQVSFSITTIHTCPSFYTVINEYLEGQMVSLDQTLYFSGAKNLWLEVKIQLGTNKISCGCRVGDDKFKNKGRHQAFLLLISVIYISSKFRA